MVFNTHLGSSESFSLDFNSVRNISSPEDLENNRKIYVGHMPIRAILGIPTDENVRDYLLEADGKQRAKPTKVHSAIKETLVDRPQDFSVLNGGIVIVARDVEIDEKNKKLILSRPSIINGSQTQGVINDFFKKYSQESIPETHIKFEIIVTEDDGLIAEISISRNFQNDVMAISIAGRLGQLDELELSIQKKSPTLKLRKTETHWSNGGDYVPTEKLLQVITALIPSDIWTRSDDRNNPNKVYTYSRKAQCLKEFQDIYKKAKDEHHVDHQSAKLLYQFYLDISSEALDLYKKWKSHNGFKGSGLHALERDDKKNIVDIPDGIIFPILASMSVFAKHTNEGWIIQPPEKFSDDELIQAAKVAYIQIAKSNPQTMGKNAACYTQLYQITSLYKKLTS